MVTKPCGSYRNPEFFNKPSD